MVEDFRTIPGGFVENAGSINFRALWGLIVVLITTSVALGQTTTTTVTKTVQNPEPWTVIEFPHMKEVIVALTPAPSAPDAEGQAKVIRTDEGTSIDVHIAMGGQKTEMLEKRGAKYRGWKVSNTEFKTCIKETIPIEDGVVTKTNETCKGTIVVQGDPAMNQDLQLYAVDDYGEATRLGSVEIKEGRGRKKVVTPLAKFMLVISPEKTLTTISTSSPIAFQSAVPPGFAVIPIRRPASGERVAAATGPSISQYSVPMLKVPTLKQGADSQLKIDFSEALVGVSGNVVITPREDGRTEVKVRIQGLKDGPEEQPYILWAVSPDEGYWNLGRIVNLAGPNEAELKAVITWPDFGLLITLESSPTSIVRPSGPLLGVARPGL